MNGIEFAPPAGGHLLVAAPIVCSSPEPDSDPNPDSKSDFGSELADNNLAPVEFTTSRSSEPPVCGRPTKTANENQSTLNIITLGVVTGPARRQLARSADRFEPHLTSERLKLAGADCWGHFNCPKRPLSGLASARRAAPAISGRL